LLAKQNDYEQIVEEKTRYLGEDPVIEHMTSIQLAGAINGAKKKMEEAAAELDFLRAAKFRDEMNALKLLLERKEK
ncbi:MAG: UvrB/UvrC motif-containing protein, partial [Bacteroidales bacterium]